MTTIKYLQSRSLKYKTESIRFSFSAAEKDEQRLIFGQKGAMIMDNMIAVGFIAMIIIGIVSAIPVINHKLSVAQFQKQEAEIASAAVSWKKQRPNYSALTDISQLCTRQLLDKSICGSGDGAATNPFGGDWDVVGSNGTFTVTAGLANLDATNDKGRILDLADTMAPSTRMQCSSADSCSSISVSGNTLAMTH